MYFPIYLGSFRANQLDCKDHLRVDNSPFKALASVALGNVPANLLDACVYLYTTAEIRVRSGLPCDNLWMDQIEDNMKQHILT